jgi:SAM-dependent methyltransferase
MTAAADAYDKHVGRYGAQLSTGLVSVAGVRPGERALDVGCGPGALTLALAEVVGAQQVAAVDPNEAFVEACRARVPGADVRVGAGERLPFADDHFDAVLAQLVVQLMDDPEAGVSEMARVGRPGGTVAACVWDSRRMPLLRAFWDASQKAAPERAAAIDEGRQIGYSAPEELGELFARGGLVGTEMGEMPVTASYSDIDDLMRPFATGVGHSGACFVSLDPGTQSAVVSDVQRRLGSPSGSFSLTAYAWWARGHVPA